MLMIAILILGMGGNFRRLPTAVFVVAVGRASDVLPSTTGGGGCRLGGLLNQCRQVWHRAWGLGFRNMRLGMRGLDFWSTMMRKA